MMKFFIPLIITILSFSVCFCQDKQTVISGIIVDSGKQRPLMGATITASKLNPDSQDEVSTLSDSTGFFLLKADTGTYQLSVSHYSYYKFINTIYLIANSAAHLIDTIQLKKNYTLLNAVIVTSKPRIKIAGDTLIYNASSFAVKPNSSAFDLVKRLPGFQVNGSGITVQGEQVQKVYVDGQDYFGSDVEAALDNLDADMITLVEVVNDRSETSKLSGIDDGTRSKAVNIRLSKSRKKGLNGKIYAGIASGNRYNTGLKMNLFAGKSHFAFIASSNNINRNASAEGPKSEGDNQSTGFRKIHSVGTNYSGHISKNIKVSANYLNNNVKGTNVRYVRRNTLLADSTLLTEIHSDQDRSNVRNRGDIKITFTPNIYNTVMISSAVTANNSSIEGIDTISDYIIAQEKLLRVQTSRIQNTENTNVMTTNNILWSKKFRRPGRVIMLQYTLNQNNTKRQSINKLFSIYNLAQDTTNDHNLLTYNKLKSDKHNLMFSYTEPLGANSLLQTEYGFNQGLNESTRLSMQNELSDKDEVSDENLYDFFKYRTQTHRSGINYRYSGKIVKYQVGISAQKVSLSGTTSARDPVRHTYTNFIPTFTMQFSKPGKKHFSFVYRGQNNPPNILQTQEVPDVSNYPYIKKGNPLLKDEMVHNLIATYNKLNNRNFSNLNFAFFVNLTDNKIVNSLTYDGEKQIQMPVNDKGFIHSSASINYNFPFRNLKMSTFSSTTRIGLTRTPVLINGNRNIASTYSGGKELGFNNQFGEILFMDIRAGINYNQVKNSIAIQDADAYFVQDYSAEIDIMPGAGFNLSTMFAYSIYSGKVSDNDRRNFIWDARISKEFLRNSNLEVSFSCNNIFGNEYLISRNIYENVVEEVRENLQGRYFLLQLTYNFIRKSKND